MNGAIFIAENELINFVQELKARYGLSFLELMTAMGVVEGRLAQADYTEAAYKLAAEQEAKNEIQTQKPEADQN